ncbi:MAG: phosphotransferase [Phycisphaerae bacterium]
MTTPRETLTSEELARVLSNYDLGIIHSVRAFPRGHHGAAKVVIATNQGKFLLKRRPRGKSDPYRVAFAHALQKHLAGKNFPLPHLIGTRDHNNSMLKIGDAIYEMFEFIESEPYDAGLVAAYEAGKMLGLYHRLIENYQPEWDPPRGHYHDSPAVRRSFKPLGEKILESASTRGHEREVVETLQALRTAYKSAAATVNEIGMTAWESQIVHSDWHPGNMLFDKGHVVAVIDFDAARIQPRVSDIANGTLQFSLTTGGRDLNAWPDNTDDLRAKRFLRGYDEMIVISRAELAAVPHLMQEGLIAQAVFPILRTGAFAGLDGFGFLKVVLRKVQWLCDNAGRLMLDAPR